ncbi:MAG: hypothetical protein Q4G67_11080 [Actinomycetia bacterium]|nr:hypothetical protein [Actinomycetes bacterium]
MITSISTIAAIATTAIIGSAVAAQAEPVPSAASVTSPPASAPAHPRANGTPQGRGPAPMFRANRVVTPADGWGLSATLIYRCLPAQQDALDVIIRQDGSFASFSEADLVCDGTVHQLALTDPLQGGPMVAGPAVVEVSEYRCADFSCEIIGEWTSRTRVTAAS